MRFGIKLFICVLILLIVATSAVGNMLISASFNYSLNVEKDNVVSTFTMIQYSVLASASNSSGFNLSSAIDAISQLEDQIGSSANAIRLFDSKNTYYSSQQKNFSNELYKNTNPQKAAILINHDESGKYYLQVSGKLSDKFPEYNLEFYKDITYVYDSLHSQQKLYYRVFVITLLAGGVIALIFTYRLTSPLKRLAKVSRQIAEGNLDCRSDIKGHDEISDLSTDFNNMAVQLIGKINLLEDSVRRQQQFVGAFAHEMKTPMTSIIGYADLIRSYDLSTNERQKAANYIFTEGKRLEKLSIKLLDLLVLQKRDFPIQSCSPAKIIKELSKMLVPILNKNSMLIHCSLEYGTCLAEPDLFRTVLINLIDNARKAMPNGGKIYIEQRLTDDGFNVLIRDTGIGIPETEIEKIKEAFYRVDKSRSRSQGGVGLGLAICNEIIKLHNGTMEITSRENEGTTVFFIIRSGRD
jgi:signal transduction histidine kinase